VNFVKAMVGRWQAGVFVVACRDYSGVLRLWSSQKVWVHRNEAFVDVIKM